MKRENSRFSIIVSFNELAWIAVFALAVLYTSSIVNNEKKVQGVEAALEQMREKSSHEAGLRKELLGLKGDLSRVVFVVDCSGSMRHRWESTYGEIIRWLTYLNVKQSVLVLFSDDVTIFPANGSYLDIGDNSSSRDLERLLDAFKRVKPSGNTNTEAALERAYQYEGVTSIVLFTDGEPRLGNKGNGIDLQMVSNIYSCIDNNYKIPINVVGVGEFYKTRKLTEFLMDVASRSGGQFIAR